MTDFMGERMKRYEAPWKAVLPPRTYTVVRVDGRSFHTFLKGADRPYDAFFGKAMEWTAKALCEEMSGAVMAYVQSDEISVVLADFATENTQPWFNGVVQKIASVSASIATAYFNRCYNPDTPRSGMATFDARVFTIPQQIEVANYLMWRQQDAVRNAVSMAASAHFSHEQCHGKKGSELQEMLFQQRRINFNDYPLRFKRGGMVTRVWREGERTYFDPHLQQEVTKVYERQLWRAAPAEHFDAQHGGFLARTLPTYGSMQPETIEAQ